MTTKKPRSPQEKKALSYELDRRNDYNSSDKSIRRLIPLRKAQESRKSRRKANTALQQAERIDEVKADLLESSLRHDVERVGGWRKWGSESLGDTVRSANERREHLGMSASKPDDQDDA